MKIFFPCKPAVIAAAVSLFPLASLAAEDLSYRYIEVDYINLDIDQPNEDSLFREDFDNGDGLGISVSFPISVAFFVYADYSDTESDFSFINNLDMTVPGSTDLKRLNLGLGFIMPVNDMTDLVFSGGYSDIDYGNFSLGASASDDSFDDLNEDSSDGYSVDVKLRSQLSQAVEGSLGVRYTDIQDMDGFSLIGNLMYEFSPNWGLNVSVDGGDELVTYAAGVRYSF